MRYHESGMRCRPQVSAAIMPMPKSGNEDVAMPDSNLRPTLPRKVLGKTGIEVTIVGLGCGPIGTVDGKLDEEVAVQTVWSAIEAGVSLIDTAPLYQHFA